MVEPTVDEDRKVEGYLGAKVPSRSDPDYAQPTEAYYAENGVRYLHACVVSEARRHPTSPTSLSSSVRRRLSRSATIPAKPSIFSAKGWAKFRPRRCIRTRWRSVLSTPLSIVPPGR